MLGTAYVEHIHDELVTQLWPGTDPIQATESRDLNLLASALSSPFQSAGGQDIHPGTIDKGAALFRSLIANHPFQNGNKRTAVIALDLFFMANSYALVLTNSDMYKLAERTASYKSRGITHEDALMEIISAIESFVPSFDMIETEGRRNEQFKNLHGRLLSLQTGIRSDQRNKLI